MTSSTAIEAMAAQVPAVDMGKLKWRCRRGLLENDLFVQRFFEQHEAQMTPEMAHGLMLLMDLSDNDLLDLLLVRKEPEGEMAHPDVLHVLSLMRTRPR